MFSCKFKLALTVVVLNVDAVGNWEPIFNSISAIYKRGKRDMAWAWVIQPICSLQESLLVDRALWGAGETSV